jgi:hypothetical protein
MTLHNNDKRFDIDLQYGQLAESSIADMLQNKKLEVKTERDLWVQTGNIVVEFESRNKPSGIQSTEADFWFHNLAIGNDIQCTLVFPVDKLRQYIRTHTPDVIRGGDNRTSLLYKIELKELFDKLGKTNDKL